MHNQQKRMTAPCSAIPLRLVVQLSPAFTGSARVSVRSR